MLVSLIHIESISQRKKDSEGRRGRAIYTAYKIQDNVYATTKPIKEKTLRLPFSNCKNITINDRFRRMGCEVLVLSSSPKESYQVECPSLILNLMRNMDSSKKNFEEFLNVIQKFETVPEDESDLGRDDSSTTQ